MSFLALERQLRKRNAAEMLLSQKRNPQYYMRQQVNQTPGDRATCLHWPRPCTLGLSTLLSFLKTPSMWGCQTTDSSASEKQMASSQDRATILQPSPRINTISLWMMNGLAKGNPGPCRECALGKVKCLFRYYNFSVNILSKRKHLCFSLQCVILPNFFTGCCGLRMAGSWDPHIACSLLPHCDRGGNWKSRSEKTCGLR